MQARPETHLLSSGSTRTSAIASLTCMIEEAVMSNYLFWKLKVCFDWSRLSFIDRAARVKP